MSFGGSNSQSKNYYKPALPYLQQFQDVGNTWLNQQSNPATQEAAAAGNAAIQADVNGAGYNNPYIGQAATAITDQAGSNLARQQAQTATATQAQGLTQSNKASQLQGINVTNASNDVTNKLNQLGAGNYAAGQGLALAAAPQAVQAGQVSYDEALQIAQLYGGLGSGNNQSTASLLGTIL